MYVSTSEAILATRYTDWTTLLSAGPGTAFPVILDGEPVTATVVEVNDREDSDNERNIHVVIKLGDQYFKKSGWGDSSSYCYGDGSDSWESGLTEVRPVEKAVVYYEV